jgi:hypothetical protein
MTTPIRINLNSPSGNLVAIMALPANSPDLKVRRGERRLRVFTEKMLRRRCGRICCECHKEFAVGDKYAIRKIPMTGAYEGMGEYVGRCCEKCVEAGK